MTPLFTGNRYIKLKVYGQTVRLDGGHGRIASPAVDPPLFGCAVTSDLHNPRSCADESSTTRCLSSCAVLVCKNLLYSQDLDLRGRPGGRSVWDEILAQRQHCACRGTVCADVSSGRGRV